MTIQYEIMEDDQFSGATIVFSDEAEPFNVPSTHPQWEEISTGLVLKKFAGDEERLKLLIRPALVLDGHLSRISERVAFRGGTLYFDGDPVNTSLSQTIVDIINQAGSVTTTDGSEPLFKPFVNFLEKLYTNPSEESRDHLFDFIQKNGINILPNGNFVGYKGVREDRGSVHAGPGIVNGTEYKRDHLPNPDGAVVEIPRSLIDKNRGVACSVGLHVGKYDYAAGFGPVLLNVEVNPRDVVSVPSDADGWKIRVSRYTVLGLNTGRLETAIVQREVLGNHVVEKTDESTRVFPLAEEQEPVTEDDGTRPEDPEEKKKPATFMIETQPLPDNYVVVNGSLAVETEKTSDDDSTESKVSSDFEKRTKRMVEYVSALPDGCNYKYTRNKSINSKNRKPFDAAMKILGKSYGS